MNKNIPGFILIYYFFLAFKNAALTSHEVPGSLQGRFLGFAPCFQTFPKTPCPLGLGQDMCGQLEGEGEQAVPLAGVTKQNMIIYGTDFLQVVLQGWG